MNKELGMEVNIKEAGAVVGIFGVLWAYCRCIIGLNLIPMKDVQKDLKEQTKQQWDAIERNKDSTHKVSERVTAIEAADKVRKEGKAEQ